MISIRKAWAILRRALGWREIVALVFGAALLFAFALHRHTLIDWVYSASCVAALAFYLIVERRKAQERERVRTRALDIVRRLEREGKGLGDASREELEAIQAGLESQA